MTNRYFLNRAIVENGFKAAHTLGDDFPPLLAKMLEDRDIITDCKYIWNMFERGCWRCITVNAWKDGENRLFMAVTHSDWKTVTRNHMVELYTCEPYELKIWFDYFNSIGDNLRENAK